MSLEHHLNITVSQCFENLLRLRAQKSRRELYVPWRLPDFYLFFLSSFRLWRLHLRWMKEHSVLFLLFILLFWWKNIFLKKKIWNLRTRIIGTLSRKPKLPPPVSGQNLWAVVSFFLVTRNSINILQCKKQSGCAISNSHISRRASRSIWRSRISFVLPPRFW